ncbi:MAG: prepilin-type N-terminal cleavage/methylation domain-containing protein [Pyrinomonadaceae bacterium]
MKTHKGFSLIELLVVVIIIAVIAAIAIPGLLASRRAANEASAIQTLRTINSAEGVFLSTNGSNSTFGSLNQLSSAGMLDATFVGTTFTKSGYTFVHTLPATPTAYCADALPVASSGIRAFGIDNQGAIYQDLTSGSPCAAGILDTTGGSPLQSN